MMESIWIMPSSTARSIDCVAFQNGPRNPNRSHRKARTSASDFPSLVRDRLLMGSALPADAGFGEAGHAAVAGDRGAHDRNCERGARAFAEAHAEIEERRLADRREQAAMAGLGRA